MKIDFDPTKHADTLKTRGLDMSLSAEVFEGDHISVEDDRADYGEARFITIGFLRGRMVVLVWTQRGDLRRIISMRKANDREQRAYGPRFG